MGVDVEVRPSLGIRPHGQPYTLTQWSLKLWLITAEPKDRAGLIPQPV